MVNMLTNQNRSIGILVGSLREGSLNQLLADRIQALSPVALTVVDGLDRLPHFNEDLEGAIPTSVAELRTIVSGLDALIVVTPEYNSSLPGLLSNAIAWLSRPFRSSALSELPVAVIGASPSPGGAAGAVMDSTKILRRAGAKPLDDTVTVPHAHRALSSPLDAELERQLSTTPRAGDRRRAGVRSGGLT